MTENKTPRISIVCPVYNMDNATYFLNRNLASIENQTFKDYEIVISDDSDDDLLKIFIKRFPFKDISKVKYIRNKGRKGMANNTNHAIDHAEGKLIKILFQDDYFYNENSLTNIIKYFTGNYKWFVTACTHTTDGITTFNDHQPWYQETENSIGSPSVLTFKKEVTERFDPQFHWVLDLDLYKRLFTRYGKPKILDKINVVIGIHSGQHTNLLSDIRKALEHRLLMEKYEQN